MSTERVLPDGVLLATIYPGDTPTLTFGHDQADRTRGDFNAEIIPMEGITDRLTALIDESGLSLRAIAAAMSPDEGAQVHAGSITKMMGRAEPSLAMARNIYAVCARQVTENAVGSAGIVTPPELYLSFRHTGDANRAAPHDALLVPATSFSAIIEGVFGAVYERCGLADSAADTLFKAAHLLQGLVQYNSRERRASTIRGLFEVLPVDVDYVGVLGTAATQ